MLTLIALLHKSRGYDTSGSRGVQSRRERGQRGSEARWRQIAKAQPEYTVAFPKPCSGRQLQVMTRQQIPEARDGSLVECLGAQAHAAQRTCVGSDPLDAFALALAPVRQCLESPGERPTSRHEYTFPVAQKHSGERLVEHRTRDH